MRRGDPADSTTRTELSAARCEPEVIGRPPTRDEAEMFERYLAKRSDRLAKGIEQMLWAMVCSPEFLMNH